jgi:hypothetical protein
MQSNLNMALSGTDAPRENLVVVVRGFFEVEGSGKGVGVQGINPSTRQKVVVFLTTTGPEAENPRRISLAKLRDGYRVQRQTYRLEPGGVIAFSRAVQTGKGVYTAPWPEVLAYDNQQAKETCARFKYGMVVMLEEPKPDRSPGDLFAFRPDIGFKADTPKEVSEGVAEFFASRRVQGHTFRIVAHVVGEKKPQIRMQRSLIVKDGDQWRPMDAGEAASWARNCAKAMSLLQAVRCFSVMPVETYRLSKMLDPEKVRVPTKAYYRSVAGDREYGTRVTYVKLSGLPEDEERFINSFFVEGPYEQRGGVDPASLKFE